MLISRVVTDLVRREQGVEAHEGSEMFPMLPGRLVLLARSVRGAKVCEVAGVFEKGRELVDVVRGAEASRCEASGSSGGLFGCGRAQGVMLG